MSLENSFNKIKRNAGIKKCLIIDGNIGDVYLSDEGSRAKIVTLREYLEDMFREMDYREIIYWDRVEGAIGMVDSLKLVDKKVEVKGDSYEVRGLDLDDEDYYEGFYNSRDQLVVTSAGKRKKKRPANSQFKSPADIFNIIYKNLIDANQKSAFIINWSEYLFDSSHLTEDERENITLLSKAIKDRKVQYISPDCNESVVVILLNKASSMQTSLYCDNPEVEIITLQKPDREERKRMIEKVSRGFSVELKEGTNTLLDDENLDCIDLLEDFTNREIIQLARMSRKEDKMTFEKLFYLFKYGEKDNPWEKLEYKRVKNIRKELEKQVVGQEEAIKKVENAVIKAYMGLTGIHKKSSKATPKGVLFFVGPTGVGKTELCKAVAKFLFGDVEACIRFDMSEYAGQNSDQKLIGAPPGYVGYEEGGQLTNAVKEHPFSVILFDEIEKAAKPNPRILDIFLQILEDGRLTDSKGQTVYFGNTVIVFTSNLGSSVVKPDDDRKVVAQQFTDIVKEYFDNSLQRPELLGRIGYSNIVPFNFIKDKAFQFKICKSKLTPLIAEIKEKYKLSFQFEDEISAISYIISEVDLMKGGRDILNAIDQKLIEPLSEFLFENKELLKILPNSRLVAFVGKSGLNFEFR